MNNQSDENGTGRLDEALQREIDQALGDKSIEELFDETLLPMPPAGAIDGGGEVAPGQVRRGLVIDVDAQGVLVELGGKDQGIVPLEQFEEEPSVGDTLELEVARYNRNDDLWVLSRQGAVERASWENIQEGQIVEAFVEKTNKGGLEVKFSGIDAFMPISQISLYRVEDPDEFIGQKLRCQVTEVDRHDKRVIVSARAVQELEAARKREQLLAELKEGDIRDGVVRQVMPYGAFVNLGGVDGLVHVSQMSHARIKDPAEFVKPGQKVQVQVLKIDRDADKISLGMKHLQPDPWDGAAGLYAQQSEHTGRVSRVAEFGAFVELSPGLDGLVHVSELSDRHIRAATDVVEVGQIVRVRVLEVDEQARRISLSMKGLLQGGESPDEDLPADDNRTGKQAQPAAKKRKKPRRGGLD
ncbi:MAG: S1 RNA-binding domain-containing protein [Planctomycetota bacterium]|nr:S1 RNA-binding domain-containing protein [Planctomycetota bacterium]